MSVTAPMGWTAAGVACGTKRSGKLDLALVFSPTPASVAGAFTTSRVPSAHVTMCKPRVSAGTAHGFCVSAGIANAFTGQAGIDDAEAMAAHAASAVGVNAAHMLVCATGTIGHRLPMDIVRTGIDDTATKLGPGGGEDAANAIRTTDAYAKTATRTVDIDGVRVTIGGMAKGAGMIAPTMVPQATLLVFVTTDARLDHVALTGLLERALPTSFNAITVDGCMSTSDTVLVFANGAAGVDAGGHSGFEGAFADLMSELAYAVVADGEGATRVVRVQISGAASDDDAYRAAREVASSILVRCAMNGSDPNYGRIVQALGQAGVALDPSKLIIRVAGVEVSRFGADTGAIEVAGKALAAGGDAVLEAELGLGSSSFEYLTCDLTTDYVTFNSEYTT